MTFGNLKKWELISLGAAAAVAIVLRILEENGVLSLPRTFVIIFFMVFVGVFFLRRPAAALFEFVKTKSTDKEQLSTVAVDIFFAVIAEGILLYLLLNYERGV